MNSNGENGQAESKYPLVEDELSVKRLLHPKLQGYYEFEMTRLSFQSEIDLKFYKAVDKNDAAGLEKLLEEGHSPDRFFRRETIRLITSDYLEIQDFDHFKREVKTYEDIQDPNQKISIVEKIQDLKSLLSISLEQKSNFGKKATHIADILLKYVHDLNLKDETTRLLSDYKEKFDSPASSTTRFNYWNVLTSESSYTPIVGKLASNNDMDSFKLLAQNLKAQIDFNSPKIHKKEVMVSDQSLSEAERKNYEQDQIVERFPIDLAVENQSYEMVEFLKAHGADVKLLSRDSRKAYRKLEFDSQENKSTLLKPSLDKKRSKSKEREEKSL